MDPPTDSEIADAYIRCYSSPEDSPDRDQLFWAFEWMTDISWNDPERCLRLILTVIQRTTCDTVIEILAAGPLEDLLAKHGTVIIDRVEEEARQNPAFASLLGGVWKSSMPDERWNRVLGIRDRRGWDGTPK